MRGVIVIRKEGQELPETFLNKVFAEMAGASTHHCYSTSLTVPGSNEVMVDRSLGMPTIDYVREIEKTEAWKKRPIAFFFGWSDKPVLEDDIPPFTLIVNAEGEPLLTVHPDVSPLPIHEGSVHTQAWHLYNSKLLPKFTRMFKANADNIEGVMAELEFEDVRDDLCHYGTDKNILIFTSPGKMDSVLVENEAIGEFEAFWTSDILDYTEGEFPEAQAAEASETPVAPTGKKLNKLQEAKLKLQKAKETAPVSSSVKPPATATKPVAAKPTAIKPGPTPMPTKTDTAVPQTPAFLVVRPPKGLLGKPLKQWFRNLDYYPDPTNGVAGGKSNDLPAGWDQHKEGKAEPISVKIRNPAFKGALQDAIRPFQGEKSDVPGGVPAVPQDHRTKVAKFLETRKDTGIPAAEDKWPTFTEENNLGGLEETFPWSFEKRRDLCRISPENGALLIGQLTLALKAAEEANEELEAKAARRKIG